MKLNIISMSSTGPLKGLNHFNVIFYYFSTHFRQYLNNNITNVGFQWISRLWIVHVIRTFLIAPKEQLLSCKILRENSHHSISKWHVLNISPAEELDWPVLYSFQLCSVGTTCLPDYNLRLFSKNYRITCIHSAQN